MQIVIPFLPQFEYPMIDGIKTMTCRTKRMGSPGDTFEKWGHTFLLTHVFHITLGDVARDCRYQEGCDSIEQFQDVWSTIHPLDGYDPEQVVWAHCFRVSP